MQEGVKIPTNFPSEAFLQHIPTPTANTRTAHIAIPTDLLQSTERGDGSPIFPASMASFLEQSYSLVHQDNASDVPTMSELRTQLEKGSDESKVETMKRILTIMLNGDPMPQLLMHIIRFVMPSKHKALKKLLYFYYEICPKLDASGKLKQEMILVWYELQEILISINLTTL